MFPPQTSLIPVTVAFARFLETNGLSSFFGHYPHWYLGVPARYLFGPVVPALLLAIHKLVANVSLFDISIFLILFSLLASAVGWGVLAKRISGNQAIGISVSLFLLILPWRYLTSLALIETTHTLARNFLPFVFLAFWEFLKKTDKKKGMVAVGTLSFLLLINTSVLPILVVGMSALILAKAFRKGKIRRPEKYIKPSLIVLVVGLIVATFWYSPSFWLVVLTNPSIGGASGFKVILRLFDLLRAAIPLFLAILAVSFSGKIRSRLSVFGLTFTFTFLFLTVFRFIGDPDFWQDWTTWIYEVEIGLAFIIARKFQTNSELLLRRGVLIVILLIAPFIVSNYVYGLLGRPLLISSTIPKGVAGLEKLAEIVGNERVFLSGSTVFWANALYDFNQVRGGQDKVATHPFWDHAAFQLREGDSPELAKAWLEALGTPFVLVHGPKSAEAYHDFRNIEKWQDVGKIVWSGGGDAIMEAPNTSLAWVVNLSKLKNVDSPKSGIDSGALSSYLAAKKRAVDVVWDGPNKVLLEFKELEENEGVVLAATYNSHWKSKDGVRLKKDPFGNILIIPENLMKSSVTLQYK